MRARGLTALGFVIAMVACGAGTPKPCGWYFASDRANTSLGPIRWLSGVWKGPRTTGEQIWTPLRNGSMAGVWHRADAPDRDRFYTVRQEGAKITLVEISAAGATSTYEAVEQGERSVVFASPEHGRLSLRSVDGALELTIEPKGGAVERHHLWLEI